MGAAPAPNGRLQQLLQSAVQAVDWTYSIFWQFCPQQGVLVWSEGYYNGEIKTRKTVEPMEVSTEEASLQRSQQLRELYDTLSAGETSQQPARRAALSPEDLTESEWFYLMCVSFSFSPGVGLPGKAYARRQHAWLTGAHEVDSKVFSRAILAKSARIQTVLCIPLMDGVVELGSTERIQEDPCLIPQVKSFFVDHPHPPPQPVLSGHSTSNAATSVHHATTEPAGPSNLNRVYNRQTHADNTTDEVDDEEDVTNESDSEAETGGNSHRTAEVGLTNQAQLAHTTVVQPGEVMQLEMSEDIRLGSPDDASNKLDSDFPVVAAGSSGGNIPANAVAGHQTRAESSRRWPVLQHQQPPQPPLSTGAPPLEELAEEDTTYSQTVSSILQHQATQCPPESYLCGPTTYSAFLKWTSRSDHHLHVPPERTSQWLLKYILLTVPYLHTKYNHENPPKTQEPDPTSRFRNKGAPQDELSANHVMAERRRREKLNERFIVLRSLVPFVTKMDKASILGDTIEYLKQLRRKIQDLETGTRQMETERARLVEAAKSKSSGKEQKSGVTAVRQAMNGPGSGLDKRKIRVIEGSAGGPKAKVVEAPTAPSDMIQVSIIESNALIELQCPYKEGLLLDLMLTLREMLVEVTVVQSSLNNGSFTAELRAKVKENVNGKKASIMEVKRAINQIVPHAQDS